MERGLALDGDFRELILSLVVNGAEGDRLISGGEKVIEDALSFQDPRARTAVEDLLRRRGIRALDQRKTAS